MHLRPLLGFILIFLSLQTSFAQTGTIKGFIYDKSDGEPMIFTNVLLEGTRFVVQTDVDGYFTFSQVPAGTYTLFTTVLGYDTARTSVTVAANEIVTKKLFLSSRALALQGVEISARKSARRTETQIGTTTITPKEINLLPSAGGETDVTQYLQVVPGVIFTGDQGGQLYIRGGSPVQTGILLDGITIYNPFHSIGLYSVFETDAIRNVDVQSAAYNAQYGNRTSAIVDIRTKDGNKNRLAGKLSASPMMARGMLEGPLSKAKYDGGASSTFLISAKHSYLNQTSKTLYGGLGNIPDQGLPYQFTDLYGKVTVNADNGSKINLFGFHFDDRASILAESSTVPQADFHWTASGGGTTFMLTPLNSSALIRGKFALSKYSIDFDQAEYVTRSSSISGFEGGLDFTYFLPGFSQLTYGLEVSGLYTSLDYANAVGIPTALERRSTLASLFATYRKNFGGKFIFEPGLRMQYYAAMSAFSPEPRLGLKYNLSNRVRLKAGAGMYSQNILSTKSDRDIVNFFTGFILSPDEGIQDLEGNRIKNNLERAYHFALGLEVDVQNVEFNLEPWYKKFNQHVEFNRNKLFPSEPNFAAGYGDALGLDFSARYSVGRIYLWGTASYQKILYSTVDNQGQIVEYAPPYDRRFNLNLVTAYTAGAKKDWEISGRYNLGSPFPFTQTQGFYEDLSLMQSGINTPILTQNGTIGILYASEINGGRLSWYHRLDLSVKKRFTLSTYSNLEATFALTNAYDRRNIFYVGRLDNEPVYQLPVFPSVNLTWNF